MPTPAPISKNSFDTKFWIGYPVTSATAYPSVFEQMLVEEYTSFGTEIMRASSEPIDDTRSERPGQISFKKSKMEIKTELRHYNMQREIAGVLYANLNLMPSTAPRDGSYADRPITAMVTVNNSGTLTTTFTASGGNLTTGQTVVSRRFRQRDYVILSGCPTESNNKKILLSAVSDTTLVTVNATLVDDNPASGQIVAEVVGHRFESGALYMTYADGVLKIENVDSTPTDPLFTEFGLERGHWIFIGGDVTDERFAPIGTNYGYARIKTISDTILTFDLATFPCETNAGTGKTIALYWGTFIKNRSGYSGIIKTYKAGLLQLGHDNDGIMSKALLGMVSDEMKMTFPTPGDNTKVTIDTKMVSISSADRTGTDGLPGSTYINAPDDLMYTTSGGDNKKFVMYKRSSTTVNPTASFAYVIEGDLTMANGADVLPAIGYTEGYDVKYGILKVSGSVTCAFIDNSQVKDINSDAKYGMYSRWARPFNRYNQGLIMDMPFVEPKTDGVMPKKEDEMMLKLDFSAKRDESLNEVISFTFFNGLPDIALT
jgi:hypothetical protein